ncbi:hypothetical protein [Aliidiomarina sanyensis]|nr:hypothetical protein [Aliidiomarina sanyensis]
MLNNHIKTMVVGVVATLVFWAATAAAHHGWNWAEEEQTEMTGTITEIYIGPPHPRLMIDTPDGPWQVDLGNPRQTRDAGFVDGVAEVGDEVLIRGHRHLDEDEKLIKAVRATINGTDYTFYPHLLQED